MYQYKLMIKHPKKKIHRVFIVGDDRDNLNTVYENCIAIFNLFPGYKYSDLFKEEFNNACRKC